jgi:hypothetical protein
MYRRRLENEADRRKLRRLAQRLRTVGLELDRFVFNQFPEPLPTVSAGTALTDLFVSGWNSERAWIRRCSDPNLREFLNHQSDYSVRLRTPHVHLRPVRGEFIESRGNRCLVQRTTVLLPAIRGKAYRRPRSARIWQAAF